MRGTKSPTDADVVQLARDLGSRPFVFLALVLATSALLLVVLVLTVRWSGSHARVVWKHATIAWGKLEARPFMRALAARVPWVRRAMRSLSATEYLVIHLGIWFTVFVASVCFVKLAGWVAEGETMVAVDLALASSLRASASPEGLAFMSAYTSLGGARGVTALGIVVGVVLAWKKRRLLLVGWIVALVGVGILNGALKAAFARERPVFERPIAVAVGWSFPSGHAMATLVATGMLAYLGFALVKTPGRRLFLAGLALLWTGAMGFSRMYLGVHYLSDVVAGFAAGTVWLGACISGIEIARHRPRGEAVSAGSHDAGGPHGVSDESGESQR